MAVEMWYMSVEKRYVSFKKWYMPIEMWAAYKTPGDTFILRHCKVASDFSCVFSIHTGSLGPPIQYLHSPFS